MCHPRSAPAISVSCQQILDHASMCVYHVYSDSAPQCLAIFCYMYIITKVGVACIVMDQVEEV